MLDRIWKVNSRSDRHGAGSRPGSKHSGCQPLVEVLEGRQLLTASLAPIANVTVPAQLGYQLPLDGSGNTDPSQTFTATSSNPDIKVSVAQGQFWTVTVSHTPANSSDVTINQRIDDVSALRRPDPTDGCSHHHADKRQLLHDCYPTQFKPGWTRQVHPANHVGGLLGVQRHPGRIEQRDQYCLIQRADADRHRARSATGLHGPEPDRHGQYRCSRTAPTRSSSSPTALSRSPSSSPLISTTRSSASSSRASKR